MTVLHHTLLHDKTLAMLRCPQDQSTLRAAEPALVVRLNAAIAAHRLRNQAGEPVERAINGALVREAGDLVYPIVDQIPVMLFDEAIPLAQLDAVPLPPLGPIPLAPLGGA